MHVEELLVQKNWLWWRSFFSHLHADLLSFKDDDERQSDIDIQANDYPSKFIIHVTDMCVNFKHYDS